MSRWILVLLTKAVLKNKDRRILSPRKASIIPEAAEKAGVPVHYVENKEAAAPVLERLVRPDDVVLLKGSHGMEVYSLIDTVFRKGAKTC